jgi:hypothetical protein
MLAKAMLVSSMVLALGRCGPAATTVPSNNADTKSPNDLSQSTAHSPPNYESAPGTPGTVRPELAAQLRPGALVDPCIDEDFGRLKEGTLADVGKMLSEGRGEDAIRTLENHERAFVRCSDTNQWRWRVLFAESLCVLGDFEHADEWLYEAQMVGADAKLVHAAHDFCREIFSERKREPTASVERTETPG